MTGFELWTSGFGSNPPANSATVYRTYGENLLGTKTTNRTFLGKFELLTIGSTTTWIHLVNLSQILRINIRYNADQLVVYFKPKDRLCATSGLLPRLPYRYNVSICVVTFFS